MGRVRDFFKNLKKSKKSTSRFNSKKEVSTRTVLDEKGKEKVERLNVFNNFKQYYDEVRKSYDEKDPHSQRVYNVLYKASYEEEKNPKLKGLVKWLISKEKNPGIRKRLKEVFIKKEE